MTQGTNNQYVQAKNEKVQNGPFHFESTAQRVAKDIGIGQTSVKRAEHFSKGLDAAEEVSPGIKESVLTGEVKAPKQVIAEIAQKRKKSHIKKEPPKRPCDGC